MDLGVDGAGQADGEGDLLGKAELEQAGKPRQEVVRRLEVLEPLERAQDDAGKVGLVGERAGLLPEQLDLELVLLLLLVGVPAEVYRLQQVPQEVRVGVLTVGREQLNGDAG